MTKYTELDFGRFKLPSLLASGDKLSGIELGVAAGDFSKAMVESGVFSEFFGVDLYSDHHDVKEYVRTLKRVGIENNFKLLRMSFDDAIEIFPDEYFDFIYIDGYAHTGENAGKSLFDWYRKVKVGGIFAGHDYSPEWPGVIKAVECLLNQTQSQLMVTKKNGNPEDLHDQYPSWAILKKSGQCPEYNNEIRLAVEAAATSKNYPNIQQFKNNLSPFARLKDFFSSKP